MPTTVPPFAGLDPSIDAEATLRDARLILQQERRTGAMESTMIRVGLLRELVAVAIAGHQESARFTAILENAKSLIVYDQGCRVEIAAPPRERGLPATAVRDVADSIRQAATEAPHG